MPDNFFNKDRVQADRSRAVFILIALAGVLPSVLVLWFASLAIRNEQFATTRIEEEAHQVLLTQIKSDLEKNWNALLEETDRRVANLPPAVAFYETVTNTNGGADGLIVLTTDDAHHVAYPALPKHAIASGYLNAQLASQFAPLTVAIKRSDIGKVGRAAQAILDKREFELCVDESGRHTLSNIELLILENRQVVPDSIYAMVLSRLTARLNDYRFELIPASQRLFLMSRISALASRASTPPPVFPTLSAELLSAQFVEANPELTAGPDLNRSVINQVWQQRLPSGHGIALFSESRILKLFGEWLAAMGNPLAARVQVEAVPEDGAHLADDTEMLLGAEFPGWRLRIVGRHTDTRSLSGIYMALSVASVALILLVLIVIASVTLRRLTLAQQKNAMVATVSHELKTPVSSIKLLVDTLLQDATIRPDRVREYLQLISRENLRLSQVIENVLSFSRIERTKFRIERQQLDMAALIREAAATFLQQAEITEQELTVEIAPDIPPCSGDAWALNRVILNLLDNACKYSDPPRRIRVAARVVEQNLVVTVSDKGVGIRESDLEKIFDQFYQVDQKLSRSNEGCGLGLSIVRHIVNLHGGTIDATSELGAGSTFAVHLPLD